MPSTSRVLHELLPPVSFRVYHALKQPFERPRQEQEAEQLAAELMSDSLFGGDDALFKSCLASCRIYGEYGAGQSTIWAAHHATCAMHSVDTSRDWIETVARLTAGAANPPDLVHVDLGPLADWGRPLGYSRRSNITDYVGSPWSHEQVPDLVLVDGRFRVACFLFSLLEGEPGTKILFDDYTMRPHYHVAEEFCPVAQYCGRQALFVIPPDIRRAEARKELERFLYVME